MLKYSSSTCIWAVYKDCTFVDKKQMDTYMGKEMVKYIITGDKTRVVVGLVR